LTRNKKLSKKSRKDRLKRKRSKVREIP